MNLTTFTSAETAGWHFKFAAIFVAATTLAACSGEPGANDIKSAIENTPELSSTLPAAATFHVE